MKKISNEFALANNLVSLGRIVENDMSKALLILERISEKKEIDYYSLDSILFNQSNHKVEITISFWKN